jgi:RNA polymerase sigma-70 factor, ECF subfamily
MGLNQREKPIIFSRKGDMRRFAAAHQQSPLSGEADDLNRPRASEGVALSDETLLSHVGSGNPEALGLLFERFAPLVRGISRRILRDGAEAEDLAQDIFLFIQRKCLIFDSSKSSVRSWIVQMTYHRAIERRRYLTTRQFYSRTESNDAARLVGTPTGESDYSAEAVFGRNGLSQVFSSLSVDQRETLRLHFFEGYTLAEVSQKLGQPLGNVRHHYYRGLDKVRKQMFRNNAPADQRHAK